MNDHIPAADLDAYIRGDLDGLPRYAEVDAHLRECPRCNDEHDRIERGTAAPAPIVAPASLHDAIVRLDHRFAPGERIGDHIVIERVGVGGQGSVWSAWNTVERRYQALKFVGLAAPDPDSTVADSTRPRNLIAELREAVRLDLPHFITVHGLGRSKGDWFIAMQLAAGRDLSAWASVGAGRIVSWILPVAESIHDANRHGRGHFDVKSHNILLVNPTPGQPQPGAPLGMPPPGDPDRLSARLGDFGLAAFAARGELPAGTDGYAAPEQRDPGRDAFRSDPVKRAGAIDGFGLAATICSVSAGIAPGARRGVPFSPPDAARIVTAGLDRNLSAILAKQLDADPRCRYGSVAEFAADLRRWLTGEPVGARSRWRNVRKLHWAYRRQGPWARVGLAGLPVLAVALGLALHERESAVAEAEQAKSRQLEARLEQIEKHKIADLVTAARRAAVRDRHRELLAVFEELEDAGIALTHEMRLDKVKALAALFDTDAVRRELESVDFDAIPARLRGQFDLWRATTLFGRDDAAAEKCLREAIARELPPAEREYSKGLTAPTTPASIEHFQRAIEFDYRYQPARSDACLLMLMLGRFDDAIPLAKQSSQLFRERPEFPIIGALAHGLKGEPELARASLESLNSCPSVTPEDAQSLQNILPALALGRRIMRSETHHEPFDAGLEKQFAAMFGRLKNSVEKDGGRLRSTPATSLFGHLPPKLRDRMTLYRPMFGIGGEIVAVQNWPFSLGTPEELLRIADEHPEGLLLTMAANGFFARASRNGFSPEDSEEKYRALVAAAGVARRAAEAPNIAGSQDIACDLAVAFNAILANPKAIGARAKPEYGRISAELLRMRLKRFGEIPVAHCGTAVKSARIDREFALARDILDGWERRAPGDLSAARLRAEIELALGNYPAAIAAAERVLNGHPEDAQMREIRFTAWRECTGLVLRSWVDAAGFAGHR